MQLCIAIIIVLGLLSSTRKLDRRRWRLTHRLNLSTALIEFHKAQCYFISAISVALLVLVHQSYNIFDSNKAPPQFDIMLSLPISMNGFLPITLVLVYISCHLRLSWHTLILSLAPFALSTCALGSTYLQYWHMILTYRLDKQSIIGFDSDQGVMPETYCICGSKTGNLVDVLNWGDIHFPIIWAIFTYCFLWILWCVLRHVINSWQKMTSKEPMLHRLENLLQRLPLGTVFSMKSRTVGSHLLPVYLGYYITSLFRRVRSSLPCRPVRTLASKRLRTLLFVLSTILWVLCFAYHFYLYSLFVKSRLLAPTWTFGQIIAVTVWVPSIVEFLYIEHGKYTVTLPQ